MSRLLTSVVIGVLLVLPTPARAQGATSCTRLGQNTFVRDTLRDIYYWYQFLPDANPASYASPEAYLEAVRYRPLDSSFSYITSRAANDAFYSESQYIGLGFSTQTTGTELRVLQVFADSPASEQMLGRGDRFLEINGRTVESLIASGQIGGAFGATEEGVVVNALMRTRPGVERRVTMVKRPVTIPTVSLSAIYEVDGRKVGYLFFRNFVRPSYEALDTAFAALREARVDELVLDLRYNGGGLVDVAVHLSSLIGGVVTNGRVFAEFRHNDKNAALNETLRFREAAQALTLSRLIVIATRSSASASELVINSLRPHMPVVVIGEATYGKPVGQYGINFCDKVLAPVAFSLVNANGEGDYFGGIAADCEAADDIEHDLGDGAESSLSEAFHFIRTGRCSTPRTSGVLRARDTTGRATGFQSLLNAH